MILREKNLPILILEITTIKRFWRPVIRTSYVRIVLEIKRKTTNQATVVDASANKSAQNCQLCADNI